MSSVFILWHMGHYWTAENGDDNNAMLLGVFSTRAKAEAWREDAKSLPGFRDTPDKFIVDEYPIDERQWTSGYALPD